MQHPFDGILDDSTRRECLKSALVVGVGAIAGGAQAARVTTQAGPGHPEHGGKPIASTKAGPSHPEHGGRFDRRPTPTAAGKGVEDGNGQTKLDAVDKELDRAEALTKAGKWTEAGPRLAALRKLKGGSSGSRAGKQHLRRSRLSKAVTTLAKSALAEADKQVTAGDLSAALETYGQALNLHSSFGVKTQAKKGLAELAKQPGYADAVAKILEPKAPKKPKNRPKPKRPPGTITTLALGEEG
jgi:hypothetical protein